MADLKVLLGIPTAFTGVYTSDIFRAFMRIAAQRWPLAETECGRIDIVRNQMAQMAIDGGYTHLVMLDADHVHPEDTVHKLVRWAKAAPDKFRVVGGLQYRRCAPYEPQVFRWSEERKQFYTWNYWAENAIVEVDLLGMASVCIDVRVFATLPAPWWKYEYPDYITDHRYPSEDCYFSRTAREKGVTLWCDTSVTSPHLTTQYADKRMMERYEREHAEGTHEHQDVTANPVRH